MGVSRLFKEENGDTSTADDRESQIGSDDGSSTGWLLHVVKLDPLVVVRVETVDPSVAVAASGEVEEDEKEEDETGEDADL